MKQKLFNTLRSMERVYGFAPRMQTGDFTEDNTPYFIDVKVDAASVYSRTATTDQHIENLEEVISEAEKERKELEELLKISRKLQGYSVFVRIGLLMPYTVTHNEHVCKFNTFASVKQYLELLADD